MSDVQRICPQCGQGTPLEARHCPACGYDTQAELPMRSVNLPATLGKAALPILAGAASLAIRAGWRLLQNRIETAAIQQAQGPVVKSPEPTDAQRRDRRTIRIRSSWAVGDSSGVWRKGASEHIIELDD